MSFPQSEPQSPPNQPATGPSALSITALVLAIVIPIVGLVLGIVARATARKNGQKDSLATAAIVVGSILSGIILISAIIVIIVLVVITGQVSTALSGTETESAEPLAPPENRLVLSTDTEDPNLIAAAEQVILHRLERAGVDYASFSREADDSFLIRFGDELTEADVQSVADLFTPIEGTGGFYRVGAMLDTGVDAGMQSASISVELFEEAKSVDCPTSPNPTSLSDGAHTLVCDSALGYAYVLGEPAFPITHVASVSSTDPVGLELDGEGAHSLAQLSTEMVSAFPPDNQLAIAIDNEVITAPTFQSVITDGRLQLSGGDVGGLTAAQLQVAANGVQIEVVEVASID